MKVVLFGDGSFASLAWYCLSHDTDRDLAGFVVDAKYRAREVFHDLPVVDFEHLESRFPPDTHELLLTIGPQEMNCVRKARYLAAKSIGYAFSTYVSSRATTWPDLSVGENSMIFEGTVIQPFARIGVNTIVRSGVHISHHNEVGDHCFISAGACFGGRAKVGSSCFVGLNATIRDGVTISDGCFIAAGALVTKNTDPDGLYIGVPARRAPKNASAMASIST